VEPVGRLGTESEESGSGGSTLLLKVQTTEDLRVTGDELIALVQLLAADDTDEAADVVDAGTSCSHHELVRRYRLHAAATSHAVQSTIHRLTSLFDLDFR